MPPPEASECCPAHSRGPLVLSRPSLERIAANADVRGRQLEAAEARKRLQEAERAATVATAAAMAGTTAKLAEAARMEAVRGQREAQRRQAVEAAKARKELRRLAAEEAGRQLTLALRTREAVKQLDAALSAAEGLEQRKEQMKVRERQQEVEKEQEKEHQRLVQERTEVEREQERERKRVKHQRKRILWQDLQTQMKEKEARRKMEGKETEKEKTENQVEQRKMDEEKRIEKESKVERRNRQLEEGLRMITEEKLRKKEIREREERERLMSLAYADFKREVLQKLEYIHKQKALIDNSKNVSQKIIEAQKAREAKFESWFSKISNERKERERRMLSETESRWAERRRRAIEHRDHQLEAAEERRRTDKEAAEKENAFDWKRQQLITEEWKRLREEERRRQQVSNRLAYDKQIADEEANRAWELAVDVAEEADRHQRFQREDQEVLQHAQEALEKCRLSGKPVEPIKRAIATFKKCKGFEARRAPRASVMSHLDVGLDLERVMATENYYIW